MTFILTYSILWCFVVFLAAIAIGLLIEVRDLRRTAPEMGYALPSGTVAPEFTATDFRSKTAFSSKAVGGTERVLVFISPSCPTCANLTRGLKNRRVSGRVPNVIVISMGGEEDNLPLYNLLEDKSMFLLDPQGTVQKLFGVLRWPTSVFIDESNRIKGYGHPHGVSDLKDLWFRAFGFEPQGRLNNLAKARSA